MTHVLGAFQANSSPRGDQRQLAAAARSLLGRLRLRASPTAGGAAGHAGWREIPSVVITARTRKQVPGLHGPDSRNSPRACTPRTASRSVGLKIAC